MRWAVLTEGEELVICRDGFPQVRLVGGEPQEIADWVAMILDEHPRITIVPTYEDALEAKEEFKRRILAAAIVSPPKTLDLQTPAQLLTPKESKEGNAHALGNESIEREK